MPEHDSAYTISARGLTRNFGSHVVVNNVTLELQRGEVLGLLGPNGAGKTTTMQMLTGNLAPTDGTILVCGVDLLEKPVAAKARIGYLPEFPPLYRELTVDEYLRLAARLRRVSRARLEESVARARDRCGLAKVGAKLIGNLSKGYQQRVGIAQAIVHAPDVVILDEPTAGLDPNQIREIRTLIRELGGAHSVVLSTHILPEVEMVCDRVQIMHYGNIVYGDTIAALRQFERGATIDLGLRRPPPVEQLANLSGVVRVERLADTLFRLQFAPGEDLTESIVSRASVDGWGLYRIAPSQTSLEDVFVHLTRHEDGN